MDAHGLPGQVIVRRAMDKGLLSSPMVDTLLHESVPNPTSVALWSYLCLCVPATQKQETRTQCSAPISWAKVATGVSEIG